MSDQQLNSLDRFRKRSPNLILEQHGSCEVPAGCGGVILRWRNPRATRPVRFHIYASGKLKAWVDGEPLTRGSVDLAPGPHVLALEISGGDLSRLLRAVIEHDTDGISAHGPVEIELPVRSLSQPDGTWKAVLGPPGEGWQKVGFAEDGWQALEEGTIPQPAHSEEGSYQWSHCVQAGAAGLCVAGGDGRGGVWVRKAFEVPAPRVR